MIVHDEFGQGAAGGFTKQDELRKALLLDKWYPALREGIGMSLQMRRMATLKVDVHQVEKKQDV